MSNPKSSRQREIFQQMVAGQWEDALPKSIYDPLNSWFIRHSEENILVVRIVIFDPEVNFKFACHFKCSSEGKSVIKVFMPMKGANPQIALGLPNELYDFPVFCLPDNTLARALIKKSKTDPKKLKE